MIVSRRLAAVFAMSLSLFALGCVGDSSTDTVTGTVTIKVTSTGEPAVPMPGIQVAINDADGNLITEGSTDADGLFAADDLEQGVSATIMSGESTNAPMLQTRFGLKPGVTYAFKALKEPATLGTIVVNGTNLPSGAIYNTVYVGNCIGVLGSPITVSSDCVQSDGKITVNVIVYTPERVIYGRAAKYDLTFTDGMTVTFNDWYSENLASTTISVLHPEATYDYSSLSLAAERRGTIFNIDPNDNSSTITTTSMAQIFTFPSALPVAENGHGFQITYQHMQTTAKGPRYFGLFMRRQWIETAVQFDLGGMSGLPVEIQSFVGDYSDASRPAASWSMTGGDLVDGVHPVMGWRNGTRDVTWVPTAPADYGYVKLPVLPTSMSSCAPGTAGLINGPLLLALESSLSNGYDEYVQNGDVFTFLGNGTPTGGDTAFGMKYIIASTTDFAFAKSATGKATSASVDASWLPAKSMIRRLIERR